MVPWRSGTATKYPHPRRVSDHERHTDKAEERAKASHKHKATRGSKVAQHKDKDKDKDKDKSYEWHNTLVESGTKQKWQKCVLGWPIATKKCMGKQNHDDGSAAKCSIY